MIKDHNTRGNIYVTFNEPDICPICSHTIEPILLGSRMHEYEYVDEDISILFTAFFECTFCRKCFVSSYYLEFDHRTTSGYYYKDIKLIQSAPSHFNQQTFENCINDLSPSFVKIYNQALEAEHYNLDEIAGIGYRKALEFLIKDFLIIHEEKEKSKVNPTALGNCINTMIDNPQLKTVASRATWLGNDQTHYEQKYTDNDIKDLKKLIKLSVHWIEMIYLTEEAEDIEKK